VVTRYVVIRIVVCVDARRRVLMACRDPNDADNCRD
jgi:hypothetical protein